MLLDLSQRFVTMEGKVIKDIIKNENAPDTVRALTLLRVITLALLEPVAKLSDDAKITHFELCLKVIANKAGAVELTAEEAALLKSLIKPKYGILIVGEAMRMLEGKVVGIEIVEDIPDKQPLDEYYDSQEPELPTIGSPEDSPIDHSEEPVVEVVEPPVEIVEPTEPTVDS